MTMYNPPATIQYDDTVCINSQRIAYFRSGILKREDRQSKDILVDIVVCNEKKFILVHFIDEATKNAIENSDSAPRVRVSKLSVKKYNGKSNSYCISLNAALNNLKIYHVQRLTRVPFFWDSNPKYLALMVIDVSSLSEGA